MTHRRSARPFAPARVGRAALLGLGLVAGAAAPGAAQSRPLRERPAARAAAGGVTVGAPTGLAHAAALALAAAPDPRLGAEDVVGIVLAALADAPPVDDGAGAGGAFAQAFAFASPANRAAVGSLDRFADLVRDDAYRPLLGHRQAARGVARVSGEHATQHVVVTDAAGERVAYTFTLARQATGVYRGCWMTESVVREAPSRVAPPQSA